MCLRAIGMAVVLAAVAGTAFAASQTRLVISGAFHTTSARLVARDESCGFRTKARILGYMSNAMRIGRGRQLRGWSSPSLITAAAVAMTRGYLSPTAARLFRW